MSVHVFGAIATANGTAANNRGLTEGNITTLQKLVWNGQVHTTVSAESIRFAFRRRLVEEGQRCNRTYDEEQRRNVWADSAFTAWAEKGKGEAFADDDLLGFMSAEGAKEEGEDGKKAKGTAKVRRAVLEITRAVSLTAWPGDVTFNAASPGATPSTAKKGENPVPYGTEMHATRYQYGFALTPARLRVKDRAEIALRSLCALGEVAGNQGRFLFDFSPESVIFRITHEAAPRILYSFVSTDDGRISVPELLRKVKAGDVPAGELVIGGAIVDALSSEDRAALKDAALSSGVRKACETACARMKELA